MTGFQPTTTWVRSVYRRYGFSRRARTTTRPPVPRGLFEGRKLTFLSDINKTINEHKIPPELVLNADQTPCSYVSVGKMTMAARNSSSVPIKGLTDKRSITLTFVISLGQLFANANNIPRENHSKPAKEFPVSEGIFGLAESKTLFK